SNVQMICRVYKPLHY
ncbi:hypothetical protein ACN38_g9376, partial [Penicillium nordicum]